MEFELKPCGPADLPELLYIQDTAFAALDDPSLLRRNTPEMLDACLTPPHVTLGAWYEGTLAAFSILYVPEADEDLSRSLIGLDLAGRRTANYKLCIVRPEFRGCGLQYHLGMALIAQAQAEGIEVLCATVSPKNRHSMDNIQRMGYTYNRTLMKYGWERDLYVQILPAPKRSESF